jgi:surface antigen
VRLTQRVLVVLAALVAVSAPFATPASAAGDDYPWRASTTNAADRWGFTQRQCVSFVAWREEQAGHPLNNATQRWGNAYSWDEAAARLGEPVSTRPAVGTIAQWNAGERSPWWAYGSATANGYIEAGPYGHVGWVKQVNSDGSVLVEQYNISGNRSYSLSRVKAPRYIYYGM